MQFVIELFGDCFGPREEIKQELRYGKRSCSCADVASIGLKPPFYEDLQFLISQYFPGMSGKGAIKSSRGLMPSVMGRVIPRLIPYSSQTVFVSIRNRVQIISVFIQNCQCLSEHLYVSKWEFSIPAPPLSKGVCKVFLLPTFPNTDFYCSGPPSKFCYRFQASGCFAWSVFHTGFPCRLCQWNVALFQNS